jgi:hypothetical protein
MWQLCFVCDGGSTGGSGFLKVVPLERGYRGGSNGGGLTVAVAVLAVFGRFEHCAACARGRARDGGWGVRTRGRLVGGRVAVVF